MPLVFAYGQGLGEILDVPAFYPIITFGEQARGERLRLLRNFAGFDLDATERSLFGQFFSGAYYTGAVRLFGPSAGVGLDNAAPRYALRPYRAGV